MSVAAHVLAKNTPADATVEVDADKPGAEISRHLYGHFIEHIGGVIYGGVWVGRDSKIANIGGIRKRFIDDMRRISAPNMRWPGGCFADGYHWRDGIGPATRRPRTYNFWQPWMPKGMPKEMPKGMPKGVPKDADASEPNQFGTHEFMHACKLIGAEPYVAGNLGTGTPRELYDWVSYCNAPADRSSLGAERAANGQTEPFSVSYWGIGNESWGCGGNFKPEQYAAEYRRYVSQFPSYNREFLIAAGPNADDYNWTRGFFESIPARFYRGILGRPGQLHGWALHYYTRDRKGNSPALGFTPDHWYRILNSGVEMEKLITNHWKIMGDYDKDRVVKLVIDEWGVWYPTGAEVRPEYLFSQMMTLRDALHTAMHLDIFQRHADKIAMANVAQTINCIHSLFLADGDRFVRTPAFHVFEMYKPHMGARMAPARFEAEPIRFGSGDTSGEIAGLIGSASVKPGGITITMSNPSLDRELRVAIRLRGATVKEAKARVLSDPDMEARNTFERPDALVPGDWPVNVSGTSDLRMVMPAKAVAMIQVRT